MPRLLCLNRFVPPDAAPTAILLEELCEGLAARGWEVTFVGGQHTYRSGRPKGLLRWLGELRCHLSLLWRGLQAEKPTVLLCLTDPPGLPFTASLIAHYHGAKLAHWAMDTYPEVAAALGEVRRGSMVYRAVAMAVRSGYHHCSLISCLDEDMADLMGLRQDPRLMLCPPWPSRRWSLPATLPAPTSPRVRWLYSGNLGRAHDFETLLQAQRLLEESDAPFDLVFQGGGTLRQEARQRAGDLGLRHCHWEDYAPEGNFIASLLAAHVLVATQKTETRGMIWPSKLAIFRHLPRPLIWVGPADGAIARSLQEDARSHGTFAPGQHEALARWLLANEASLRTARSPLTSPELATALERQREAGLTLWHQRLEALVVSPH